ncbi:type II secretion system F family protein [Patescibacteria group bacterium]|nr:type II secretion system F family protein [Patescibacteria group bacterium]
MEKFEYLAVSKDRKKVRGQVEASSQTQAISILRSNGLFVVNLNKIEILPAWLKWLNRWQRVKQRDVVHFTRQLATMIKAGLPLTTALSILKYQSNLAMSKVIDEVLREVEGGGSFSKALSKYNNVFDQVYLSLVQSGEAAGVLDKVLLRLADNLEKQAEFRAKTKNALVYPAIITVAMIIVAIVMTVFVIPKLTTLYEEFDAELPAMTRILIGISNFMVKSWYLWLGLGTVGGYALSQWRRQPTGKMFFDKFSLKVPVFGQLKTKIILTEITRTLALLIESGVSIIEALEITARTADNILFTGSIQRAAKEVEKGIPLAVAIGQYEHFPPIVGQMLAVGEETGKVDEVMFNLSGYFETEAEQAVKGLTTAIEPIMMILLGVGVGFLVIAIILPIYNLTSQF